MVCMYVHTYVRLYYSKNLRQAHNTPTDASVFDAPVQNAFDHHVSCQSILVQYIHTFLEGATK